MRNGPRTKARIDKTAIALFAQQGVRATTIRDIAKGANITEGAIYRHYKSKQAMAKNLFWVNYTAFARVLRSLAATQTTWQDKIRIMIREICRMYDEERQQFDFLLMTQHAHLSEIPPGDDNPVDVVSAVFRQAVEAGELAGQPELMASFAFGLVVQPATFTAYGRLHTPLSQVHTRIADAVVAAVSVGGATDYQSVSK